MRYLLSILIGCVMAISAMAQSNVFLDRAYWKSQPTLNQVKKDVAAGNDPTQLNRFAFDATSWALIEQVDNDIIYYLLSHKGNGVNKLTHDGRTYIFWAAYKNNLEIMEYLIKNDARTDIIDTHGYSLLNFAAVTGQTNIKLYDFIIKHGADPTQEINKQGAHALLLVAPFLENNELLDYFNKKGLTLDSTDHDGNSLFHYAAKNITPGFLNMLVQKGLDPKAVNKHGENAFVFAAQATRGRSTSLEQYHFLEQLGIDPNVVTKDNENVLHYIAGSESDLNIYKYFLEKGIHSNLVSDKGRTPFLNAARSNELSVVRFLLDHIHDINHKDKDGHTALSHAVRYNDHDVVAFLIQHHARVDLVDVNNNSLVYDLINSYRSSQFKEFKSKFDILKKADLDLTRPQSAGATAWHIAVDKNDQKLLELLVDQDVDINAKDDKGMTALHLAAMKTAHPGILKWLIAQGADVSITTAFDESVHDLAIENELLNKKTTDLSFLKP